MTRYCYDAAELGPYVVDPLDHMGLARFMARRFKCRGLDAEDLFQEACAALCAAARNYRADSEASFATWATNVMKWHLLGAATDNARTGMFGSYAQNRFVMQSFRREMLRSPAADPFDVLTSGSPRWREDNTTADDARRAADFVERGEIRLDRDVRHGDGDSPGNCTPLVELIPDEEHADDTENAATMSAWGRIINTVAVNAKEADILDSRLLTDVPDTLQEIGDRWGLSRERIRQIEERLIVRLRAAAVAAELRPMP